MPEERRSGRLPAAWALTILLPPLAWALACGWRDCPFFLVELGRLFQPILSLIWLEALLAASSEWLRGRPAPAFLLGSLGVFSTFTSPFLCPELRWILAEGLAESLRDLLGTPLLLPPALLSLAWGLGAAVASGLLGEGRREAGYVLTALVALAGGLFNLALVVD